MERCKHLKKDGDMCDIYYEIDQLFQSVVSKPSNRLRQKIDKRITSPHNRNWSLKMLLGVLRSPKSMFFKAADILSSALLKSIQDARPYQRFQLGLAHILMYVSDCYRYTLDYNKSKEATQLMRMLVPDDPEAHMRLALNLAMIVDEADTLAPYFHYCVFLANRRVCIEHAEAKVVSHFVQGVRGFDMKRGSEFIHLRKDYVCSFIDTSWTILSEDFDSVSAKLKRKEFLLSLHRYLAQKSSRIDVLHMVGVLIFVHYRMSPLGNAEGKILLQFELIDALVCKVISALALNVVTCLRELNSTLRNRKKNRRRAMQKKRKLDGTPAQQVAQAVGYEVLKSMVNMDMLVPHLGALGSLALYWSIARSAPGPSSDFNSMAITLRNLQQALDEFVKIEEATCTVSLTAYIGSKVLSGTRNLIPAMNEDILFYHFFPCRQLKMFHDVRCQDVPLPNILKGDPDDLVRSVMRKLGDKTYESVVETTVQRHLEAFGMNCKKETAENTDGVSKGSMSTLVQMTVRKLRINRLIRGLEKVGGGKLCRMPIEEEVEMTKEKEDEHPSEIPPPLGQAVNADEGSSDKVLTSQELVFQLKKRRRLLGACTPANVRYSMSGSNSFGSSGGHQKRGAVREERQVGSDQGVLKHTDTGKQGETPVHPKQVLRSCPSPVESSRAGTLSQGSVLLCYAQTPQIASKIPIDPEVEVTNRDAELSNILRNFLYPVEGAEISPPSNLSGSDFWRNAPSQDIPQNVMRLETGNH